MFGIHRSNLSCYPKNQHDFLSKLVRPRSYLVFVVAAILILLACQKMPFSEATQPRGWQYADLRLVDAADASEPWQDLLAVYTRQTKKTLEIRFDFLSLGAQKDLGIQIVMDTQPGGKKEIPGGTASFLDWDVMIDIQGEDEPSAITADGQFLPSLRPKVSWDYSLDAVIVQINRSSLPGSTKNLMFQVFTSAAHSNIAADQTKPIALDDLRPVRRAPLLLAFWNSFPAYTPAQALRRWDGAHTGPFGQRHGLNHLLKAAEETGVPVVLLDLKNPNSLSALDALGQTAWIRHLQEDGIIVLPDVAYGDPQLATISLKYSRVAGLSFGLSGSSLIFSPLLADRRDLYKAAFALLKDSHHIQISADYRLIPLPGEIYSPQYGVEMDMIDRDGLTQNAIRQFIESALSEDTTSLFVMGGDLTESPLGDSSISGGVFHYLAEHPWIEVMGEMDLFAHESRHDLNTIRSLGGGIGPEQLNCRDLLCSPENTAGRYTSQGNWVNPETVQTQQTQMIKDLERLPAGPLTDLAWQAYLHLTQPSIDPARQILQANYLKQVNRLIRAADWAAHPSARSTCWPDEDGGECVLASESMYTSFEMAGARLMLAATRENGQVFQWLGPASQFAVGVGDPQDWHLEDGPGADPNEIPGAFTDRQQPFEIYQAEPSPGVIRFQRSDGSIEKVFSIVSNGLDIRVETDQSYWTQIPLLYNPSGRFRQGWVVAGSESPLAVGSNHQVRLEVQGAQTSIRSFKDSLDWLHQPEDANQSYPAGHYLPFPIIVVDVQAERGFEVILRLEPIFCTDCVSMIH